MNAEAGRAIYVSTGVKLVHRMGYKLSDVCIDIGEAPPVLRSFEERTGGNLSPLDWMLWLKRELNFDRTDFASYTGLAVGYLRQIEQGALKLTDGDLGRIARAASISIPKYVINEWDLFHLKKSYRGKKLTMGMWIDLELQLRNMSVKDLSLQGLARALSMFFN